MKKNASDLSKAESFKKSYWAKNPRIFFLIFKRLQSVYFLNIDSYIGFFWCILTLIENSYLVEKTQKVNKYSWKHVVSSIYVMKSLGFYKNTAD